MHRRVDAVDVAAQIGEVGRLRRKVRHGHAFRKPPLIRSTAGYGNGGPAAGRFEADERTVRRSLDRQGGGGMDRGEIRRLDHDDRAVLAIELGGDDRADGQDRVALGQHDRGRRGAGADRLREDRGAGGRAATGAHDQDAAGAGRAAVRMPAVDDAARRRVVAAPEAERFGKGDDRRRGMAGRQRQRCDPHRRTTLPALAEAMQSASEPKAISTPILPGA